MDKNGLNKLKSGDIVQLLDITKLVGKYWSKKPYWYHDSKMEVKEINISTGDIVVYYDGKTEKYNAYFLEATNEKRKNIIQSILTDEA